MIHSIATHRHSPASRLAVVVMALTVFAFMLGMNVARWIPQFAPSASCAASPAVMYIPIFSGGYTDDEAARRLNARTLYPVRSLRYAPSVHGLARGRHVEAR